MENMNKVGSILVGSKIVEQVTSSFWAVNVDSRAN